MHFLSFLKHPTALSYSLFLKRSVASVTDARNPLKSHLLHGERWE